MRTFFLKKRINLIWNHTKYIYTFRITSFLFFSVNAMSRNFLRVMASINVSNVSNLRNFYVKSRILVKILHWALDSSFLVLIFVKYLRKKSRWLVHSIALGNWIAFFFTLRLGLLECSMPSRGFQLVKYRVAHFQHFVLCTIFLLFMLTFYFIGFQISLPKP